MESQIGVRLLSKPFSLEQVSAAFYQDCIHAGAIVTFAGLVRPLAGERRVTGLTIDYHPGMTQKGIEDFALHAMDHWPLSRVSIVHRTGFIGADEPIVFVGVSAEHRRAAYQANDLLMDYLKTAALFWKKEHYTDGASWIEPRDGDYKDAQRWDAIKMRSAL